jgi:SAM-dependent methyltransferase
VPYTIEKIQADQKHYASNLIPFVRRHVRRFRGTILDVGGSTGVVVSELSKNLDMQGTVLDPAEDEIAVAKARGVNAVAGSLENYTSEERYDLVLLCRTFEHLMDLRRSFARIHTLLKPGGFLFCDIADFMELCQQSGPPKTIAKIDHRYWLTQSTAPDIFRALGFNIVSMDIMQGFGYYGYLLESCEPVPPGRIPEEKILELVDRLHRIELDWTEFGESRGISANIWYRAYRVKRFCKAQLAARLHKEKSSPSPVTNPPEQPVSNKAKVKGAGS